MATTGPWPLIALFAPPFCCSLSMSFFSFLPYLSFSGSLRSNNLHAGLSTRTTNRRTLISKMSLSTSHHSTEIMCVCVCVCLYVCMCPGRSICSSRSVICLGWLIWVIALQIRVAGPCGSDKSLEKLLVCTHTLSPKNTHASASGTGTVGPRPFRCYG